MTLWLVSPLICSPKVILTVISMLKVDKHDLWPLWSERCPLMFVFPRLYRLDVGEARALSESAQPHHYLMFHWVNKDVTDAESSNRAAEPKLTPSYQSREVMGRWVLIGSESCWGRQMTEICHLLSLTWNSERGQTAARLVETKSWQE